MDVAQKEIEEYKAECSDQKGDDKSHTVHRLSLFYAKL